MKHHNRKLRDRVHLLIDEVLHALGNVAASEADAASRQIIQLTRLEDWLLMSASPIAVVAEMATLSTGEVAAATPEAADPSDDGAAVDATSVTTDMSYRFYTTYDSNDKAVLPSTEISRGPELIVIDSRVEDADTLLAALLSTDRDFRLLRLDPVEDGLEQITDRLASIGSASAIHLISHGRGGELQLGATTLNAETLPQHAAELVAWQHLLTENADLFVYGCDVASGPKGWLFVDALSKLTGADVASSVDATGAASLGGDWILEHSVGSIDTQSAFSQTVHGTWLHTLVAPVGEFQVNSTTSNDQTTAAESRGSQNAVAIADDGRYVVVWTSKAQDGSNEGVYARRFDGNGDALIGEIQVNTYTISEQAGARVATDAVGNFVVTWTSTNQDGASTGVYARRFAADGTALTAEFRVNVTASGDQQNSVIAMSRSGQFVIAWQGNGPGDSSGIFQRRFAADGTALDLVDRQANAADRGTERDPAVAMDANGNSVVFWEVNNHLYFQRFDDSGGSQNGEVQVDNILSTSTRPSVAMDGSGNFTVVYRENFLLTGVWGKGYNADGTVKYSWFQADSGDSESPSIAMAADGTHIVTYHKTGDGNGTGVFARAYNADGSAAGSPFQVNQHTSGDQKNASIAMSSATEYVIVWSGEGATDSVGVFARQFGNPGTAPVISSNGGGSSSAVSIAENSAIVTTVTAVDSDLPAQTLGYSISGGADAASFAINATTGQLGFVSTPDFETPTDTGGNNEYEVIVCVGDGLLTDTQTIAVTVTAVNDNTPTIISDGGGAIATVSIAENSTGVTTVTATDADLPVQTLTFSISGGADATRFTINSTTGELSFVSAPNFDAPIDVGGNNVYDVIVQASDGSLTDTQTIAVTVTAVNDNAPTIISDGGGAIATVSIAENSTGVTTVTATDADLPVQTLTFSISGGADATRFTINSTTGALSFISAANFDAPTDVGGNNVYDVIVQASDGSLTDTQTIAVTVTAVNDNTPTIISDGGGAIATVSIAENSTGVTIVTATDADLPVQTLTYSISGGVDATRFTINSTTGALSFVSAPNFDAPTDVGGNNVYDVIVQVSDGSLTDTQAITVTVTAVNDNSPTVTNRAFQTTVDQTLNISAPGLLSTAVDVDGDSVLLLIQRAPLHGSLLSQPDGSFMYLPDAGFTGADAFQFAVTDGTLTSPSAEALINVQPPFSVLPGIHPGSSATSGGGSEVELEAGDTTIAGPSLRIPSTVTSENGSGQNADTGNMPSISDGRPTGQSDAITLGTGDIDDEHLAGFAEALASESSSQFFFSITGASGVNSDRIASNGHRLSTAGSSRAQLLASSRDTNSAEMLNNLQSHREEVYRQLAVETTRQAESFEDNLTRNTRLDGRMVGSVGVVTTGFSVGYLLWAVRGGMLLSGVLAQMPAWTMLDPLLVIDGNPRDDDKESLQTIMDRQQAKLTPKAASPAVIELQKAVVT